MTIHQALNISDNGLLREVEKLDGRVTQRRVNQLGQLEHEIHCKLQDAAWQDEEVPNLGRLLRINDVLRIRLAQARLHGFMVW